MSTAWQRFKVVLHIRNLLKRQILADGSQQLVRDSELWHITLWKWFIKFTTYPSDELQRVKWRTFIITSLPPPNKMSSRPARKCHQSEGNFQPQHAADWGLEGKRGDLMKQTQQSLTRFFESSRSVVGSSTECWRCCIPTALTSCYYSR